MVPPINRHAIKIGLVSILAAHPLWMYASVFVLMLLEGGEMVLFTAIYFMYRGIMDPYIAFPLLYGAVVGGDICWYIISPWLSRLPVIRHISRMASVFDSFIERHPLRAMIISKFAYGLHHPMILRFAHTRVPKALFVRNVFIVSFLWIIIMSLIGFAIFESLAYVETYVRFAELGVALAFLGFFIIQRFVSAYFESLVEVEERVVTKQPHL